MRRATPSDLAAVDRFAAEIAALGMEVGLPSIAVSADLSSPDPMVDADGEPFAETVFQWLDPKLEYWKDRSFALKSPFVLAARFTAEPFYYSRGRLLTWRPSECLDAIDAGPGARDHGVASAIVAPSHLPGGLIAAVVWASPVEIDVAAVFAARADGLQSAALRFMSAYHEARGSLPSPDARRLTRREIQCLKWAAAGKTDVAIGELVHISAPTVRFHLKNAAAKLRVSGRYQAVREAAALGYVGLEFNPAPRGPHHDG
jgi:DNA-binding CsgD family transcriptional regulator